MTLIGPMVPFTPATAEAEEAPHLPLFIVRGLLDMLYTGILTTVLYVIIKVICWVIPFDRLASGVMNRARVLSPRESGLMIPGEFYILMFVILLWRIVLFRWVPRTQRVGGPMHAFLAGLGAMVYLSNVGGLLPLKYDNFDSAGAGLVGAIVVGLWSARMQASDKSDSSKADAAASDHCSQI